MACTLNHKSFHCQDEGGGADVQMEHGMSTCFLNHGSLKRCMSQLISSARKSKQSPRTCSLFDVIVETSSSQKSIHQFCLFEHLHLVPAVAVMGSRISDSSVLVFHYLTDQLIGVNDPWLCLSGSG